MMLKAWTRAVLAVCFCLALAGCKANGQHTDEGGEDGEKKAEAAAIPVEVAAASRAAMTAAFQGTANLQAEAEAEVVTKTSGVVLEIAVEEGDSVRKGEVLARLDSDRQRLDLAQSRANLRKLENEFKRQQELFERKLISQDVFERARFDLETQKAAYDIAELQLSYTEIRAPIEGVVSKRMVKVGNLIQINQALFKIDDFDPLEAVVNVPEREMSTLAAGQPVQMLVDAMPGQVFIGTVGRVSPVVDPSSGTFRVVAQFRDPSGGLRSGMFGRVRIVYDQRTDALVVPRAALIGEGSEPEVFVVDNGVVKRTKVKIGYTDGGNVEILEGLTDGQQVVTLGQSALRDGTKVQVIQPQA